MARRGRVMQKRKTANLGSVCSLANSVEIPLTWKRRASHDRLLGFKFLCLHGKTVGLQFHFSGIYTVCSPHLWNGMDTTVRHYYLLQMRLQVGSFLKLRDRRFIHLANHRASCPELQWLVLRWSNNGLCRRLARQEDIAGGKNIGRE